MPDKLAYIPNDDIQNYPFFKLQLVIEIFEPTIQNSLNFPEVVMPVNKKML